LATSFHGFLVKEKIGSGGMSTVYKGVHETLGYPVAIKVLHPGMAGDKGFIARFEREAKAASSLRNNNIASVIDFGSEDDIYFIIMEFVAGEDLGQILSRIIESKNELKSMPIEIVLSILEEVAYGLRDAHEQGIIHRDIKPTNILLDKRGEVKIADFGLARDTSDMNRLSEADLTVPGTVVGTPSFMSPEQAAGRELDSRTDIFSLGVMAYQLIMGEKPFQGKTATEVQEAIITQDPPALTRERCPLLTREVEHFITKMLAKDPNRRFQNMDQVLRSLSECMESVDTTGNLSKFKRDYLNKFSRDPLEFSVELRRKGISNHLTQGYHYQKMGLSNIDDAIREFTYVLSLDPGNEKAAKAIAELMKNAEESGIVPAFKAEEAHFDAGVTQVLQTSSPAGPPPLPPASKKAGRKKAPPARGGKAAGPLGLSPLVLYGGGAAVVIIIILAIVLWPGGDKQDSQLAASGSGAGNQTAAERPPVKTVEKEDEAKPQETTPPVDLAAETPAKPVPENPGQAKPAEKPVVEAAATAPPKEEPKPAAKLVGTLRITSQPSGATVYLKGLNDSRFDRVGTTPHATADLEEGQWEIRLEKEGFKGRSKVYVVMAGVERPVSFNLDPVVPPKVDPGFVRVVISPYGDVYLNGELKDKATRVAVIEAKAGNKNQIRIQHGPTIGDIILKDFNVTPGDTLDLGRKIFNVGTLIVASNTNATIKVDGIALSGETPVTAERVLVGEHLISATKAGLTVDKLWVFGPDGKVETEPVDPKAEELQYRINVVRGETLRIKFDLKTK
jgi:serine/threonine protein kinase